MRNDEEEYTEDGTILPKISGTIAHWKYCGFVLFHPREVFCGEKESWHEYYLSKKDENMMDEFSQYKRVLHLGESCQSIKEKEINQTNKVDEDQKR